MHSCINNYVAQILCDNIKQEIREKSNILVACGVDNNN